MSYFIDAVNQLVTTFILAGFTPEEIIMLKQFRNLKMLKELLYKRAKIQCFVDCNEMSYNPSPSVLTIIQHVANGIFIFDETKISIVPAIGREDDYRISGMDMIKKLHLNNTVFNFNLGHFLYQYQELIPHNWNGKRIWFWGTQYKNKNGVIFIPCLEQKRNTSAWVEDDYPMQHYYFTTDDNNYIAELKV